MNDINEMQNMDNELTIENLDRAVKQLQEAGFKVFKPKYINYTFYDDKLIVYLSETLDKRK